LFIILAGLPTAKLCATYSSCDNGPSPSPSPSATPATCFSSSGLLWELLL